MLRKCKDVEQEGLEYAKADPSFLMQVSTAFLRESEKEDWELKDLRGFSMRRGHRGRVVHKKNPNQGEEVLPGRTSFKRKAGGNRCPARCGMCRPGRYQRAGGAKASKKVKNPGRNSLQKLAWVDVVDEARQMQRALTAGVDVLYCRSEEVPAHTSRVTEAESTEVPPVPLAPRQPRPKSEREARVRSSLAQPQGARRKRFACKCCGPVAQRSLPQALPNDDLEDHGFVLCGLPAETEVIPSASDQHCTSQAVEDRPLCTVS